MLEPLLERIIADLLALDDGAELERARERFDDRAGAFAPGDACYEERIQFFFDWFVADWRDPNGRSMAARWIESASPTFEEAQQARAFADGVRSLYEVVGDGRVVDLLGGARYRVGVSAGRERDIFDGRLLVLADRLTVAPGIIFHPPETHDALRQVLRALEVPRELPRADVLDGLLRMRMRLERFTSIRPQHIYRFEALEDRDILSAGWARRG